MEERDLDPNEALVETDYEDPNPEEITDKDHPDYVEPAEGVCTLEDE